MEPANEEALPQGAAPEQHTQPPESTPGLEPTATGPDGGPSSTNLSHDSESHSSRRGHASKPSSLSGIVPPYWRHYRAASRASQSSTEGPRRNPITLEDHTGDPTCETNRGLWASGVKIDDYVIVEGITGVGAYVVWNCKIETLDVRGKHTPSGTLFRCGAFMLT
jgi:hypothetical protein